MNNPYAAIFILSIHILTMSFAPLSLADQELPEHCVFFIKQDEPFETVVMLDGTTPVELTLSEEKKEYQILLPRADNGRGNGIISYSNLSLPIGDAHNYALIEEPLNDDSNIILGTLGEESELVFEITNFVKRANLVLHKVLTIEEVEECNQYLEIEIYIESLKIADGLVYIPLFDYGIEDQLSVGIKASDEIPKTNETENAPDVDTPGDDQNDVDDGNDDVPSGGEDHGDGPGPDV